MQLDHDTCRIHAVYKYTYTSIVGIHYQCEYNNKNGKNKQTFEHAQITDTVTKARCCWC